MSCIFLLSRNKFSCFYSFYMLSIYLFIFIFFNYLIHNYKYYHVFIHILGRKCKARTSILLDSVGQLYLLSLDDARHRYILFEDDKVNFMTFS